LGVRVTELPSTSGRGVGGEGYRTPL